MDQTTAPGIERATLIKHLQRQPGQRPSDIARRFDVHPSTAEYHLRVLERNGALARVRVGRELCHYPTGTGWCQNARAIHARLTPAGRAAVLTALEHEVFPRQLVIEKGYSSSAVRWALTRLCETGALERLAWGVYKLVPSHRACLQAAVSEAPCVSCNEAQEPRRATSNPSPKGRMETSRSL